MNFGQLRRNSNALGDLDPYLDDPYHNPNLAKDRADCTIDTSMLDTKLTPAQETPQRAGVNLIGYIRAEMGVGEAARYRQTQGITV